MDPAQILRKYQVIAVIGCSRDVTKDAHTVPAYLKSKGYRVVPINPSGEDILGEKSYKTLAEIPYGLKDKIEVVDIFRPSSELLGIIQSIIKEKRNLPALKVIWTQLGIQDDAVKSIAEQNGFIFVQNRCMMRDYKAKISFST
ncbi:MAG: CoA-binding protein [Candidatus Aenigmarchaeota archaeon]|nr:CoA-binding protein [Candidatus Aenigmarchaeota archaeon]